MRHLTQYEIELNQKERNCRDEIEKLEMQEASLDWELAVDMDESRRMRTVTTLRAISKVLLARH
jgi:hypothetical protein